MANVISTELSKVKTIQDAFNGGRLLVRKCVPNKNNKEQVTFQLVQQGNGGSLNKTQILLAKVLQGKTLGQNTLTCLVSVSKEEAIALFGDVAKKEHNFFVKKDLVDFNELDALEGAKMRIQVIETTKYQPFSQLIRQSEDGCVYTDVNGDPVYRRTVLADVDEADVLVADKKLADADLSDALVAQFEEERQEAIEKAAEKKDSIA